MLQYSGEFFAFFGRIVSESCKTEPVRSILMKAW